MPFDLTVAPLSQVARRIDEHHASIKLHAKGMLLEAKAAGEYLLEAKRQCPHGTFKTWVEANTRVSYRTASKYMKVARLSKDADLGTFEGVDAFIDAHAEKKAPKPNQSSTPEFTKEDAEYAQKIISRMESVFEGERDVAQQKLESFAQNFGMTADEVVKQSEELNPHQTKTDHEVELDALRAELLRRDTILSELRDHFRTSTKDDLIEILAELKAQGIWKE